MRATEIAETSAGRWALILGGGDGVRLRSLTRLLEGDERPKQFCRVIGGRTLLEQTWWRAGLVVPPERTHEGFYEAILGRLGARHVIVQPENRGTAAGILYPLLRLSALAPADSVVVLPSDHHVSDEPLFMSHVATAFEAVEREPDRVLLLGIAPDTDETEYGWIEPGEAIGGREGGTLCRVRRFWEKPSRPLAEALRARGALWNSFVMVARVAALLTLIRSAAPELYGDFATLRPALGTPSEEARVRGLYTSLAPADFSRQVLTARPDRLGLVPVRGVLWSDLGSPERVEQSRRRSEELVPAGA
jgi:mannose-1-phosphate guanylyltransferase